MELILLFLTSNVLLRNSYVLENLLAKFLLKHCLWFLLQPEQLYIKNLSLTFMYSRQDLQSSHLLL